MIKVRFPDGVYIQVNGEMSTHLKMQKLICYIYSEVSLHRITTLTQTYICYNICI